MPSVHVADPMEIKFESVPGTFTNGAHIIIKVRPGKKIPSILEVEVSKSKVKFTELELLTEYKPWVKWCLEEANRFFMKNAKMKGMLAEFSKS